eukprot:Nk52_evm13s211 gene=Nk52_evmTU13s211
MEIVFEESFRNSYMKGTVAEVKGYLYPFLPALESGDHNSPLISQGHLHKIRGPFVPTVNYIVPTTQGLRNGPENEQEEQPLPRVAPETDHMSQGQEPQHNLPHATAVSPVSGQLSSNLPAKHNPDHAAVKASSTGSRPESKLRTINEKLSALLENSLRHDAYVKPILSRLLADTPEEFQDVPSDINKNSAQSP